MAERADSDSGGMKELAEEAILAGIGAVALTKDRAEELVGELAQKGKLTQDDARELVDEVVGRWRGDALRMSERAGATLNGFFRELGLVTRREHEELELRLAQLEHRLRLIEGTPKPTPPPPGPGP
jgi:polyhydroxyalkanoate synthesis regulator phasin